MITRTFFAAQRGITLVETCIAMAVTAILASAAAPGMQGLLDARRIDGAANQLAADIQFIRTETIARDLPLRLSFYTAGGGACYVIHSGDTGQCDCAGASSTATPTANTPTTTTAAQCTGDAQEIKTVRFDPAGRVALQSNVTSMLFDPLHGTATPAATLNLTGAGRRAVRLVVNAMGRARTCSPQGSVGTYRVC